MVGDTLQTDILGGNKFGLDTVLVLSGNTLPKDAENRITSTGIVPTYICDTAVVELGRTGFLKQIYGERRRDAIASPAYR